MEIASIKISENGIEIRFAERSKEEIENCVIEAEDTERERLTALSAALEAGPAAITAGAAPVERSAKRLEITYADGAREEVEDDVHMRNGPLGEDLEERAATKDDTAPLEAPATGFEASGGVIVLGDNGDDADDDDFEISGGGEGKRVGGIGADNLSGGEKPCCGLGAETYESGPGSQYLVFKADGTENDMRGCLAAADEVNVSDFGFAGFGAPPAAGLRSGRAGLGSEPVQENAAGSLTRHCVGGASHVVSAKRGI